MIYIFKKSSDSKLKTGKVPSQDIKMRIRAEINVEILAQNVRKTRLLKMRLNTQLLYY